MNAPYDEIFHESDDHDAQHMEAHNVLHNKVHDVLHSMI